MKKLVGREKEANNETEGKKKNLWKMCPKYELLGKMQFINLLHF